MKGPFCIIIVLSVFYVSTNEQCLTSVRNKSITVCDGSTKFGSNIFIDFHEINRPCTCTATPSFAGELLVTSRQEISVCFTQVYFQNGVIFRCQSANVASQLLNVQNNESFYLRAEYVPSNIEGTFYHCIGLKQKDGLNVSLSVTCGSPSDAPNTTVSSKTISTITLTSMQLSHASSPAESSIDSASVVNTIENTDVTQSSNTTNVSYDSLSMESAQDDQEMLYIIAGSAGGGAIILVGLIILILVLINRTRSARDKNGTTEGDMGHTNKVFDNNAELPDNPLYLSSQPVDELGYSSDQEKQLGLPPTDSKTKKKINSNYDVPPNNKPIDNNASSMPVYAVPKRDNDRTPNVSTGDVYAEVCKPNRSTAQSPIRKRNEDGLLYMEVEQDTAATKQTNTNDKNEIIEGVCYAEIKRT